MDTPLSPAERKVIDDLLPVEQRQVEMVGLDEYQEGLPQHLINFGEYGIPQYTREELRFSPGDPLQRTFERLIDLRPGENISGALIRVRKKLIGES